MLFDAQPPSTTPYTARELKASTYRIPIGTSAMIMSTTPHGVGSGAATGITAKVTSEGTRTRMGASTKKNRDAVAGSVSSFRMFLIPSAMGCRSPKGPTRFGPRRSWIHAETRRSASVV